MSESIAEFCHVFRRFVGRESLPRKFIPYRLLKCAEKKPSSDEVHQFVGGTLGMKRDEVLHIQYSRNIGTAFVESACSEQYKRLKKKQQQTRAHIEDGKHYKLRLVMVNGTVEVKLFFQKNQKIFVMSYGELLSIRKAPLRWYSGGCLSRTDDKNIPSYVTIESETTLVSYYGKQQSYRHCVELVVPKLATSISSHTLTPLKTRTPHEHQSRRNSSA